MTKEEITNWFKSIQDNICKALEDADGGAKFQEDLWKREEGGGGRTRIIQGGKVIEKGGVAFSAVHGPIPEFLKNEVGKEIVKRDESQKSKEEIEVDSWQSTVGKEKNIKSEKSQPQKSPLQPETRNPKPETFYATGVSIVIHPASPMVPIIHMNVRYFEMDGGIKWFGGGIDLTPHYVVEEDAKYFHQYLKNVCDKFNPNYYPDFKKWADDYFFIKHRNETRGVGGIFFDHLKPSSEHTVEQLFDFVKGVGESFAPIYTYFMNKNKNIPYGEKEKQWQLLRRGRYVEFNLVYDRGTRFGLETNGRTESILMSLPQTASWSYNFTPEKGGKEAQTLALLKKGMEWG